MTRCTLKTMLLAAFSVALIATPAVAAPGGVLIDADHLAVSPGPEPGSSCGAGKMWVPEGSVVITNPDSSLRIVPPAGFAYVGLTSQAEVLVAAEGSCSCKCTAGGGSCLPSIYKGNCSCTASDGCTACELSTGGAQLANVLTSAVRTGGFINLAAGIRFLEEGEDLPAAFDAMFEVPEVSEALAQFTHGLYRGERVPEVVGDGTHFWAPPGYKLAPVNAFGRAAFLVVPQSVQLEVVAEGGSCSCTEGSCTYKHKGWPVNIDYCEGSCTGTCTLTLNQAQAQTTLQFDNSDQ